MHSGCRGGGALGVLDWSRRAFAKERSPVVILGTNTRIPKFYPAHRGTYYPLSTAIDRC